MLFSASFALACAVLSAVAAPQHNEEKSSSIDVCGTYTTAEDLRVSESLMRNITENNEKAAAAPIPVFVHVIHADRTLRGGLIPDAQIRAQIEVMNRDFRPSGFSWQLAGIDRTLNRDWFNNVYFNTPQERQMKTRLRKGGPGALNVYTVGFVNTNKLLGYATFPWSYASNRINDGVVLFYRSLPGSDLPPYNLGRTLVHEAGHWLGLFHTFEGGCTGAGDGVADTPSEQSPAFGCPVARDTCRGGGPDPIRNYMDYTDDACQNQFTRGQTQRAIFFAATYRGIR